MAVRPGRHETTKTEPMPRAPSRPLRPPAQPAQPAQPPPAPSTVARQSAQHAPVHTAPLHTAHTQENTPTQTMPLHTQAQPVREPSPRPPEVVAPAELVRREPPPIGKEEIRSLVGEIAGPVVSMLQSEVQALGVRVGKLEKPDERVARLEERLAALERLAAQARQAPAREPQPVRAPEPVAVAPAPVAPAAPKPEPPTFVAAPAPKPAAPVAAPVAEKPAPARVVEQPVIVRRPELSFDVGPDSSDLPFIDGARRQRRFKILVVVVLLGLVGAFALMAVLSQSNLH